MDKIVISDSEVQTAVQPTAQQPAPRVSPAPETDAHGRLPRVVPLWARLALPLLVLALPILCLTAIIVRVIVRGRTPREQYAWASFMQLLLIIGGLLNSAALVVALFNSPLQTMVSEGVAELDERTTFPSLPSPEPLPTKEVSEIGRAHV